MIGGMFAYWASETILNSDIGRNDARRGHTAGVKTGMDCNLCSKHSLQHIQKRP